MARGDIQNDAYSQLTAGSQVNIQPSSGDEYDIVFFSNTISEQVTLEGQDGTNETGNLFTGTYGNDTAPRKQQGDNGFDPISYMITNSQYCDISQEGASTMILTWGAVEMK